MLQMEGGEGVTGLQAAVEAELQAGGVPLQLDDFNPMSEAQVEKK